MTAIIFWRSKFQEILNGRALCKLLIVNTSESLSQFILALEHITPIPFKVQGGHLTPDITDKLERVYENVVSKISNGTGAIRLAPPWTTTHRRYYLSRSSSLIIVDFPKPTLNSMDIDEIKLMFNTLFAIGLHELRLEYSNDWTVEKNELLCVLPSCVQRYRTERAEIWRTEVWLDETSFSNLSAPALESLRSIPLMVATRFMYPIPGRVNAAALTTTTASASNPTAAMVTAPIIRHIPICVAAAAPTTTTAPAFTFTTLTREYTEIRNAIRTAIDQKGYTQEQLIETLPHFVDPISYDLISDPVIVSSGQTYDRQSITDAIRRTGPNDPMTREQLTIENLVPNLWVRREMLAALQNLPALACSQTTTKRIGT